jgi:alanine racemase
MSAMPARPRVEVVINLDAIRHNVGILVGRAAASGAATMVVVKADGYGHGAIDVAEAALQAGASALGVCSVEEALELRHGGIDAPVLAWLRAPGEDLAAGLAAGVELGVYSTDQLDAVAAAAAAIGTTARVHLKVDTTTPDIRSSSSRCSTSSRPFRWRGMPACDRCGTWRTPRPR